MTKEELLQASDKDLPRMLGEVLQPEKNGKHNWSQLIGEKTFGYRWRCLLCGREAETNNPNFECERAFHEIPLTPANAFKWRDWACKEYSFRIYMEAVRTIGIRQVGWTSIDSFMAYESKPKHYLIAAAICALEASHD